MKISMKIGLIRGGQLGYMLIEAGMKYSDLFFVLDSDEKAPCRNFCKEFTISNPLDADAVEAFGSELDAVIVEFEHVSVEGLKRLEKRGIKVYPQADVLASIQDKCLQKQFFKQNELPTSNFKIVQSQNELSNEDFPAVIKQPKGGYDGKGVCIAKNPANIPENWKGALLVEEKIDIEKELGIIVARNKKGEIVVYPAVEMVFHEGHNMLDMLVCPARIGKEVEKKAEEIAKKTAEAYKIVGILAVELFLTTKGEILINEVAPRAHNSGHGSIEANQTSQFEQLIRITHNYPLGKTDLKSPMAMLNLVGEAKKSGPTKYIGMKDALSEQGGHVHLYGKEESRPHRKMGHVTVLDASIDKAMERARIIQNQLTVTSNE